MSEEMFQKELASIREFGFVDPITARRLADGRLEIVDGEHRWKAAIELGYESVPVWDLGLIADAVAKQLTIVLNETRGKYDPKRMGSLLTDLVALRPLPQLLEVLPFSKTEFEQLAELPAVDWDRVSATPSGGGGHRAERWVERVYRLPVVAADKLDEALREAADTADAPEWERLQTLAEHFLSS